MDWRGRALEGPAENREDLGNLVRFPKSENKARHPDDRRAGQAEPPGPLRRHQDVAGVGLPGPVRAREDVKRGPGQSPAGPGTGPGPLEVWDFPEKIPNLKTRASGRLEAGLNLVRLRPDST